MSFGSQGNATTSRKRPRVDSEPEQPKILVNHPTLYFDDGNVILSCKTTLFCVHRTLLAKHSSVFREMLTPSDGIKPERLRGCLHVALDDSREDVEALLDVIYDGLTVDFASVTVENFPLLSSLLRMSTKYNVERPRTEVLRVIEDTWPSDLSSHDAAEEAKVTQYLVDHPAPQNGIRPVYGVDPLDVHPASVISLLRECNITSPSILAPLFYALARMSDGFNGQALGFNVAPLSHADIERLIVGVNRLYIETYRLVPRFGTGAIPAHVGVCGSNNLNHLFTQIVPVLGTAANCPIEVLKLAIASFQNRPITVGGVPCPVCRHTSVMQVGALREQVWAQMAEIFQLQP